MPKKPDFVRPSFRQWLGERLAKHARRKAFGDERNPRNEDEAREVAEILRGAWNRCWLLSYEPTEKQELFHEGRVSQIRGIWAPNQRGKTTAGIAEVLSWGFGEDIWTGKPIEKIGKTKWRPGMRFFVAAKDYPAGICEVILPKMQELLPLEEIGVEFTKMSGRIVHKLKFPEPYNFTIKFLVYTQDKHASEGMTWNGCWFDEPPPNHLYISCRRGCLRHAAPIIFTGTPISEAWMYEEIFAHSKSVHVHSKRDLEGLSWNKHCIVKVNHDEFPPGVTKEQIDAWAETLDEEEKRARIYGEFFHLQGRVYKQFDRKLHVLDRDQWFVDNPNWKDWPGFCCVDPHDRKPHAFGWGVITPREDIVFIDEWPNFDFFRQKSWRWSTDEYCEMIRDKEAGIWKDRPDPVVWRIMDPNFGRTQKAGIARTPEDEFADRGFFFDTSVDDDLEQGHMVVKSDLHNNRLFFLSHMTNTIRSLENYTWDDFVGRVDRTLKEKPKDKFKDFADVVRYVCKSDLRYMSPMAAGPANPWARAGGY